MRAKLIPQLELPPRLIPLNLPDAPTVDQVYPQPKPVDARSPGQKLFDLRLQMVQAGTPAESLARFDELLSRYYAVEEEISKFEAEVRLTQCMSLERRLSELSLKCRQAKDHLNECAREIAAVNTRVLSHQQGDLAKARQMAEDVESRRPRESDFASNAEIGKWRAEYSEAKGRLDAATQQHYENARADNYARISHATAAAAYNSAIAEYQRVKAELATF